VRLVVMIVIDQLPSWSFAPLASSFTGGLRRLLDRGIYVPRLYLPYGAPFTATGHATLATGAPPAVHGVIGNSWYRRAAGSALDADQDETAPIYRLSPKPGEPRTLSQGSSGAALRVPGLAEAIHQATGGRGFAVAVGLKARAVCFLAGQHPDDAVFFEPEAGGMTTSAAYAPSVPPWLSAHAAASPMSRWLQAVWSPLDPVRLAAVTGIPDDAPGEDAEYDLGGTFPHRLAASSAAGKALSLTPFGDRLVLETARAAITARQLGADDLPDLLAISLNSHDFAGHAWGQGSWEQVDLLWRLDLELGAFLTFLDERVGASHYAVVLTSDHGATPMVERSKVPGARRIAPTEIIAVAEAAMDAVLGSGDWVANVSSGNLYVTAGTISLPPAQLVTALDAAALAVARIPGIAGAGRYAPLLGADLGVCDRGTDLERAMCMSAAPSERGELYVVASPGSLVTPYRAGTGHDAPSEDNRRVPLLLMAPGVAARIETAEISNLSVAPTVARLLGVLPPEAAKAPPIELGTR
jgi:hypothetical protein